MPVPAPTSRTLMPGAVTSRSISARGYRGRWRSYSSATEPKDSARRRSVKTGVGSAMPPECPLCLGSLSEDPAARRPQHEAVSVVGVDARDQMVVADHASAVLADDLLACRE